MLKKVIHTILFVAGLFLLLMTLLALIGMFMSGEFLLPQLIVLTVLGLLLTVYSYKKLFLSKKREGSNLANEPNVGNDHPNEIDDLTLGQEDKKGSQVQKYFNFKIWNLRKVAISIPIVFFIIVLLIPDPEIPVNQQVFIDKWKIIKKNTDKIKGNTHLIENRSKVDKWRGVVSNPGFFQTEAGGEVRVHYGGIKYTLKLATPLDHDENRDYNELKGIEGSILFSGFLNGEQSGKILKAISHPKMLLKCTKITSTDGRTVYYHITPEEFLISEKQEEEKRQRIEKEMRACRLKGCSREGIGWNYYENPTKTVVGMRQGVLRLQEFGYYCSRAHCLQGEL